MSATPHDPVRDAARTAALRALELELPDSPAGEAFGRLTRLAARLLGAPVALVALVEGDRELFRALVDPHGSLGGVRALPLARSFCRPVVESGEALWVEDAAAYPPARDLPEVREGPVRAYAGVPLRTPGGHVLGALCVRDFRPRAWTEEDRGTLADLAGLASGEIAQRVAVAELARSAGHYRRLVTSSPFPIYVLDAEGRFVETNPASEAILQRDQRSLIGAPFAPVVAPEFLPEAQRVVAGLLAGAATEEQIELELVRPSGERRRVCITATAIREDGAVTGVHGIARDVTEEHELQEEMRLMHAALGGLSQGVRIADEEGRTIFANRAYGEILGTTGAPPADEDALLPDDEARAQEAEIRRAVLRDGQWSGPVWRRRPVDGRRVQLDLLLGAVEGPDGGRCFFSIVQDATERIARERHLRRTERLAGLGTLVGGVAHELNNPLTSIKSFAALMRMDARDDADREVLEVMQREADRAAQIVANLGRLARGTQEEDTPRVRVDLNEVVAHVLRVRRYTLGTHNVEVRTDYARNLPPILADRGQMEQVLLNLVVNAEQALAGRPEPRIIMRTRATDRGVSVYVVDNGPGIAADRLERIFDPFFTTKAPGEGTGLGLSLVHGMVAEHGGVVHVDSEPGKGTAFRVDFPRAPRGAPPPARERPAGGAPAHPLRVLVVDDEDSIRRTLQRFLQRRGHHVQVAGDGAEALRLLDEAREPFDAILSDVRMPGLGGDLLLARLRERGDGMDQRLVFMSGDALNDSTAGALSRAGVPVVLKPFDLMVVADTVEHVGRADD